MDSQQMAEIFGRVMYSRYRGTGKERAVLYNKSFKFQALFKYKLIFSG